MSCRRREPPLALAAGSHRVGQKPRTGSPMESGKNAQRSVTTLKKPISPATVRDLRTLVQEFGGLLRREFATEIERDARGFKGRVLVFLKAELPGRPGRPRAETVTRAAEMKTQGKSWQQIYAECLQESPGEPEFRQLAQSRLRSAVRARRNVSRRASPREKNETGCCT
jgi:hypothetical protein